MRDSPASNFLFAVAVIAGLCAASLAAEPAVSPATSADGPLSTDEALAAFRLQPNLSIELVAAEPLVESPVAMAFDERGRMYVAENRGYPTGPGDGQPPAGRIARLEDTDGDGRFDRRTTFADGLTFPNGVLPWREGLIVTCAPDILYLKDADGDGRADLREVLFTGFSTSGSTQLRVSHPTLSVDNWVYVTSGLTGGKITSPASPDRSAVELGRTDFRFRSGRGEWEAADGGAQFGLTFDDFGRRFICYNRVQVQHVVLSARHLRRNPLLAFSETVENCPAEVVSEPLPGHGSAARLFPISKNVTTADSHAGTFTAACAVTLFRGDGLPALYQGAVFSCDPTGNLVHCDRLEPRGATFAARAIHESAEFLASTDNWFRPVYLAHGPDGCLYICDMYRKTIEHPDYLPVEIRKHTDFDGGKGMGRIYRVSRKDRPVEALRDRRRIDLRAASTRMLCDALGDTDGWRRDVAHRLLAERQDSAAVPLLQRILADGNAPAAAAAHALWLLELWQAVDADSLKLALHHRDPGVREIGLQLAEGRLTHGDTLMGEIVARADDENPRVRFQCALALGATTDSRKVPALARIALAGVDDRWTRAAVFSSIAGRERQFLDELIGQPFNDSPGAMSLYKELGRLLAAGHLPQAWPAVVGKILSAPATDAYDRQVRLLTGFAEGVAGSGAASAEVPALTAAMGNEPDGQAARRRLLDAVVDRAIAVTQDAHQPPARRIAAAELLGHSGFSRGGAPLLALAAHGESMDVQLAAVRALGRLHDPSVAAKLLAADRFGSYTPALREGVLSTLLANSQHLPGVLAAIEAGTVPIGAVDSLRRTQFTEHRDPTIRERAARLFTTEVGDRAKVYEEFKTVLQLEPTPSNGRAAFKKTCAACHRLDQEGTPVGPDLFGIRNQPKEAILLHLLIPEYEIAPSFAAYVVETGDGRVLTGLVAAETTTSITLRQSLGKEETILRGEIVSITASKLSLMPQELEKTMTRQELADLIAYLKGEQDR